MESRLRVRRAGCELVGEVRGQGRDVVLVHGAGMNRSMFDAQVPALVEGGCRVLTFDLRGHGESRPATISLADCDVVSEVVAMMDEAAMTSAVLVGQSLGGNICQHVARSAPDRVDSLVVIDSAWNAEELSPLENAALRALGPLLSCLPWPWSVKRMAKASAATSEGVGLARRSFAQLSREEFVQAWETARGQLTKDRSAPSGMPLLLICGELDGTGQVRRSMQGWATAAGTVLHRVPQAGHLANVDRPELVNELLLDFIFRGP
ncbi:alpha/beta fold hydrolase [Austwickia chelonae]|uniref:alpha/beta fold hydrolase n=1 Tax=Austwickia chelonae TaxID=100225 RepID=UPI000E26A8BE|nr:alpha/beta hydrolase [Austwickia chelonae]